MTKPKIKKNVVEKERWKRQEVRELYLQSLWNKEAYQRQMTEERSFTNAWEILSQEWQEEKHKKARTVVEEDHLLLFLDTYDDVILNTGASICMQVDIQKAYVLAPIVSIDYGFRTVNDDEVILDLETPTECEDKE